MRKTDRRPQQVIVLVIVVLAGMLVAKGESFPAFFVEQPAVFAGQSSPASGDLSLHGIVESAHNAELRWPDFARSSGFRTDVSAPRDSP